MEVLQIRDKNRSIRQNNIAEVILKTGRFDNIDLFCLAYTADDDN